MAGTGHDQREPRLAALDTLAAAREACGRIGPLADAAGLKLRVEGEGGHARAVRGWLGQVLLALLENALKYSERGGTMTVRADGACLSVEDEGSGISEEDLPRVFEPLYRGEPSGSDSSLRGGAGLGLSVSRELVERMGGTIRVDSREGPGTAVRVTLPEAVGDSLAR